MKGLESIFKIYNIKKALVKNGNKIEIVILEREKRLTLNDWINLINNIKFAYKKEVLFIVNKDNCDLSKFVLIGDSYE